MSDVDILVDRAELARVDPLLVREGYRAVSREADTIDYREPGDRLRLDLHHHFALFAGLDLRALTCEVPVAYPGLGTARLFRPAAMLAHLAVHLNEHRDVLGYRLRWIADAALFLRTWCAECRWSEVTRLLPVPLHQLWALRLVRFCRDELRVSVPEGLLAAAAAVEPLGLPEVLRSQRIARWRLRSLRGWVRLGACALGLHTDPTTPLPRLADVLGWSRDLVRERHALRLAHGR